MSNENKKIIHEYPMWKCPKHFKESAKRNMIFNDLIEEFKIERDNLVLIVKRSPMITCGECYIEREKKYEQK